MAAELSTKAIGSLVQIKENGVSQEFFVAKHGYPAAGNGRTLLVRRRSCNESVQWSSSSTSNAYASSVIDSWLNNTYLTLLQADIRGLITAVSIPYTPGNGTSANPSKVSSLSRKVFTLSYTELGLPTDQYGVNVEGTKLASNLRSATDSAGTKIAQPTRSPLPDRNNQVWSAMADGSQNVNSSTSSFAPRPTFTLPSSIMVDDSDNVTVNAPPTAPNSITYPVNPRAGKEITLTCGTSTDPDGDPISYIWERRIDSGNYIQIGITAETTVTDTLPASGVYYQARVKTADDKGGESGYTIGVQTAISYNDPPSISGEDKDLGDVTQTGISYTCTITDDKTADVNVAVVVNDTIISETLVAPGSDYTFTTTEAQWQRILNGDGQTLKIIATDTEGESSIRTLTFSKEQSEIEFTLSEPKACQDKPYRIAVNLSAQLPPGCDIQIQACNNAFDETPAWEDMTTEAQVNRAHIFENTTCDAERWGVDLHVSVNRNGASGECYISGFAYAFETDGSTAGQVQALSVAMQQNESFLDTLLTEIIPAIAKGES